jgi:hypothetical protein
MGEHRRDVAGSEDPRVRGRAQPVVDHDEALRRQRQAGVGEPGSGTGLRHPQRLVEFDPPAVCAEQNTRRDTHDGAAGDHCYPVIGEDPREQATDPGIMRRQQRLAGNQGYLDRVTLQSGQAMLRRKGELDPAGAAADHGEAQPRHLARPRQQRLPARREPVDRFDRDRVLGGAGDIVGAGGRADVERQDIVSDRRMGIAQHGAIGPVEPDRFVADQPRAGKSREPA